MDMKRLQISRVIIILGNLYNKYMTHFTERDMFFRTPVVQVILIFTRVSVSEAARGPLRLK